MEQNPQGLSQNPPCPSEKAQGPKALVDYEKANAALKRLMAEKETSRQKEREKILRALVSERAENLKALEDKKEKQDELRSLQDHMNTLDQQNRIQNDLNEGRLIMRMHMNNQREEEWQMKIAALEHEVEIEIFETQQYEMYEEELQKQIEEKVIEGIQHNVDFEACHLNHLRLVTEMEEEKVQREEKLREMEIELTQSQARWETSLAALEEQKRRELAADEESLQEMQRNMMEKIERLEEEIRLATQRGEELEMLAKMTDKEKAKRKKEMKKKAKEERKKNKKDLEDQDPHPSFLQRLRTSRWFKW